MNLNYSPLQSLNSGRWFKLICGASYQHLPAVRNLTLAYILAGADCIDIAPDPAAIASAKLARSMARSLLSTARRKGYPTSDDPWLMVSLNDGEDPHFRKAEFDPNLCPVDCPRPCEAICPAGAIAFPQGIIDERCYGCGRCLPVCPVEAITTRSYVSTPEAFLPLLQQQAIDALEIHTRPGNLAGFKRLWSAIAPYQQHLKLLAISCPDGNEVIDYLQALAEIITPLSGFLLWQTDGRPMSGDIGKGTTRATIKFAQKVLNADLPGFVQLAGGTNQYTAPKLQQLTFKQKYSQFAGIAYGSYARRQLAPILDRIEQNSLAEDCPYSTPYLENDTHLLWQAVDRAHQLVGQLKTTQPLFV
ncbi:MAG: LdpA C-terminal domain-containing domain [Jaaginema sp. PMC 1079.18]|nr:LdpA C-terminal domain-containing domain [Jaaginema sp. PMC 1080.18]MEC4850502.1 LdpA C-terminal domain-containing domain [Jaaginema sp. PMC 1079.18]MEC4867426.1 LdpA C-terminal domain-containing domain [Jaaginema sp. PMC 1078.18]